MNPQASQSIGPTRPTPKKVLLLGATGMVGKAWIELLENNQIEYQACSRPAFDLSNPDSITSTIADGFDLVVNAAAWTDVDGAESDEPGARRANAHAIDEIAQRCLAINATLITYSTDYVFSGNANSPYAINALIDPINAYGRSKAHGESILSASGTEHILIRTSWVYAPWGNNFVRTIRNLAKSRDELRVVDDQRGRPTSAQHLAKSSLDLYRKGSLGVWHLSDENECTWFDFASEIVRHCQLDCTITACTSDEYPRPAARPAYSTLDITQSLGLIGPIGTWSSHLNQVLDELERSEPD